MHAKNKEWFSILEGLKQDNIILKNRLSDALKKEVDHFFVEKAEFFQQLFIDKEQIIDLLRHDIAVLPKNLDNLVCEKRRNAQIKRAQLLEKDLIRVVFEFNQMKISFDQFLLE